MEFNSIRDTAQAWSYKDPFPVSDDTVLCAFGEDPLTSFRENKETGSERFKIWLLDSEGRRRLVYEDRQKSCAHPIPLEETERPPVITPRTGKELRVIFRPDLKENQVYSLWERERTRENLHSWGIPERENSLEDNGRGLGDPAGTVVLVDVYNGLPPEIKRADVKSLRIMEQVRKTSDLDQRAFDQSPVMGYGTYYAKRCWGKVPVEEDGSAHFYVPALREVYFQALNENGKELQRMTSVAQLMPCKTLATWAAMSQETPSRQFRPRKRSTSPVSPRFQRE